MKQIKKLAFYELNPRFFKDYSGNGIGDLTGLCNNFEYFDYLNVDAIILQDILLSDSNGDNLNFDNIDPKVGTMNDMVKLLSLSKASKKKILIELNIGTIKENHFWFKMALDDENQEFTNLIDFKSQQEEDVNYKYNEENKKYYVFDKKTKEVPINWNANIVIEKFIKVIRFWNDLGVGGFVIKKFEYLSDDKKQEAMSERTLKELRKFYRLIKEINDNLLIVAKTDILEVNNIDKYVTGDLKIFDYILSTQISTLDLSKKYFNDVEGSFSPKALSKKLKQISFSNANIISFGSNLSSRPLSRWMNDGQYIEESAKVLGMLLILNKASSSIYMGEEIGMPNIGLTYLDDFQTPDLEERKKLAMQHRITEKDFLRSQVLQNPINSRSIMSWNDLKNGGFSKNEKTITPVMTRYSEINVKNQYSNKKSVLNFYKELIRIARRSSFSSILQNGELKVSSIIPGVIKYRHIFNNKEIQIFVNLTDSNKFIKRPKQGKVIISNYDKKYNELPNKLDPYEGIMISKMTDEYIKTTQEIQLERIKESSRQKKLQIEEEKRIKKQKIQQKIQQEALREKRIKDQIKQVQEEEKAKILENQRQEKQKLSGKKLQEKPATIEIKTKEEKKAIKELEHNLQENIKKASESLQINRVESESFEYQENSNQKELTSSKDELESSLEDELTQVKKEAKIERQEDQSHLDEKTKLKEEELAKTTLIDDTIDIDELFENKNKK